jgi:1-phosphatidylinositol-3-phosphate 5-kinase
MDNWLDKIIKPFTGDKPNSGREFWVDDGKCKACYECETPFSVFVRRHHCRICGRIFCTNCAKNYIPPPRVPNQDRSDQAWLRVCNYCTLSCCVLHGTPHTSAA